jgi:hypothetical protein
MKIMQNITRYDLMKSDKPMAKTSVCRFKSLQTLAKTKKSKTKQ